MNNHSIGKAIAELRKKKGWTQTELAEKLNVSDKAVSKWESESGLPEILQLPTMASLFDVSIDYLMTGNEPKKEILLMSKAEFCAKNDDISLAEEVKDLPKDEDNKNIVDYILEYQSLNVFKKLCEIDPKFIQRFKILDAIKLATLTNSLFLLTGATFIIDLSHRFTFENENEIKSLLPAEDKEYFRDYQSQCACILPRDYFNLIATDKRINTTTLDILLSNQNGRECVWYHAFPYMIDEAYKNNNSQLLNRLLEITKNNNAIAFNNIKNKLRDGYREEYTYDLNYFFITYKSGHGLVRILESTIKETMENGDWKLLNELNKINTDVENFIQYNFNKHESLTKSKCYIASSDEIRVAKLQLDKTVSQSDLQVQAAIHNGIISIKELKEVNDFSAIKKALYEYPIHPFEIIYRLYQEKQWRKLFELAIDQNYSELANAVLSQKTEKQWAEQPLLRHIAINKEKTIEDIILDSWTNDNDSYYPMKQFCINTNEIYVNRNDNIYSTRRTNHQQTTIQEVADYLNAVRQRIVNELSNKFNKEEIIDELTKEYFYSELEKGNKEMVIIKLCVRMEAILKCDYHYEGDFSEMLDRFCDHNNSNYTKMLNDLRKQQNGIVHSEKSLSPMPDEEIKQCIEYICTL